MSLKKGDLVEVIGSVSYPDLIGRRYTLTTTEGAAYSKKDILYKGSFWDSPFKDDGKYAICFLEGHLRKVNPDGDELSDESFESLMTKLKSSTKSNNIVTVNIKLEEQR